MATKHKPVHPGEILKHEFLIPMGISKYRLARDTGMPADRVGKIVQGTRTITADTALRLGRYFGTTPVFWMNLQARYDLCVAERDSGREVEKRVRPLRAA